MPITSRTLIMLANQGPGIKRWRIDGVDARGRIWVHGPFSGTQAEAEVIRDAVVWNPAEVDKAELLTWVQAGNMVNLFGYTDRDITEVDGEDHIYLTYATSEQEIALPLAWWMDTLKNAERNGIATRLGFDAAQRGRIHQRFPPMVGVLPWLDATEEAP